MNPDVKKTLDAACKAGNRQYLRKFSIPKNNPSVKTKSERSLHDTQNAIESIGDQIAKQVLIFANDVDWSNPGRIDGLCTNLDTYVESHKERFIWAYAKFAGFNGNEKWIEFLGWLKEFRRDVRNQLLAVFEDSSVRSESSDNDMLDSCLDEKSEVSQSMAQIMEEQGFNGSLTSDLQGLLLAISVGGQPDVEKALRRFLIEAGRQAKEELRKKYETVKDEARTLRRQLEAVDSDNLDKLREEIAALKAEVKRTTIALSDSSSENERISRLLSDEQDYRRGLEERFSAIDEENDILLARKDQNSEKVERQAEEIERLQNELVRLSANMEQTKIELSGTRTTAEKLKADAVKSASYASETLSINGELLRDLEALQITANRRQRRINDLLSELATVEVDKNKLLEAFKRVRKTKRSRPEMQPCSPAEQSRPMITTRCEDVAENLVPASGRRERSGLTRQSGVTQITGRRQK